MSRLPSLRPLAALAVAALILAHSGATQAAQCARSWEQRQPELAELLGRPAAPGAFTPAPGPDAEAREALALLGIGQDDDGVRLPLAGGGIAILANDWTACRRGTPGCEPALRFEVEDDLADLGFWLVAGWQPRHEGRVMRLVDKVSGAVTLIGGRPHPSPSGRLAAVVAGDSPYSWSGTEIWRLDHPVPRTQWAEDALGPADYAFVRWLDDDTVLLAARGLSPDQPAPLTAVLACAGQAWHLVHDTGPHWLDRTRSPSGHRVALARRRGVVVWQDGEQAFAAATDVDGFDRWDGDDAVLFLKTGGGRLRVVRHPDGTWGTGRP